MPFSTVLFDLDGTLIDSGAIILASFQHATRTVLARDVPDEEILAHVGGTHLREHMRLLAPDRVDELVEAYNTHTYPLYSDIRAFAGVFDVLERLRDEGRRLGIVTSKRRSTVERTFEVLPLERYFTEVVTVEDTDKHKPDPEPILLALERIGAAPGDAAYVGDSPFDITAAKAAGVFAVAVTWGGIHAEERLRSEGPDAVATSPAELLDDIL